MACPVWQDPRVERHPRRFRDQRGSHTRAGCQHDMAGDGLETGAKMLARFEQDVSTALKVKPGMGKTSGVVRFPALFRKYDLGRANIQDHGAPETDFEPGLHRPRQDETAIGDLAQAIFDQLGKDQKIDGQPATAGSPTRRCPDLTRTMQVAELDAFTSLEEGLRQTWDWYREQIFEGDEVCAK